MKTLNASRRISSFDVASLFWTAALTVNYCTDLKVELIEQASGKHISNKHTAMMWVMTCETWAFKYAVLVRLASARKEEIRRQIFYSRAVD